MIHLLYGKDAYRVRKAAESIRDELAAGDDMLASNTTRLDGAGLKPQELLAHATAVPFLASNRLVIVEGLLRALDDGGKGRRRKKASADDPLAPWRDVAAQLGDPASMPPTTTLVFVEGELGRSGAFSIFAPIAQVKEFNAMERGELVAWVKRRAKDEGIDLTERAAIALSEATGADLWLLENELARIGAYADGETVDDRTVAEMTSVARETKIWDLGDAVVAGQQTKALSALRGLLSEGQPAQLLLFMIVRQYRQLVLVKDLRERRAARAEVLRASGVPPFRLDSVSALASRYDWPRLREAYRRLLDADLSVKRGLQDDESALQLVVHELCALAPSGRPQFTRPRQGASRGR